MLLNISNVGYKIYITGKCHQILKDISFFVDKGEFVSIMGPQGCGKSTLLDIISGILQPDSGYIERNIYDIGYLTQKENTLEWRSCHTCGDVITETYGMAAFSYMGRNMDSIDGKKRMKLLKTLCTEPELLILDEPFGNLNYEDRREIGYYIRDIVRNCDKGAIFTTRDLAEAVALSDRLIILSGEPGVIWKEIELKQKTNNKKILLKH